MSRKTLVLGAALLIVLVPSLRGQSWADPPSGPERELAAETGSFGSDTQDFWVPAAKFSSWDGVWAEVNLDYWSSQPGFAGIQAPVGLPAGALVTRISCYYHDADVTSGPMAFVILRKSRYDVLTNMPTTIQVGTSIQSGTNNGYHVSTRTFNETIRYRVGDSRDYYTLYGGMQPSVMFRGCQIEWNRQVTPAPASATFADVPVGHSYHRFVEALVDAGITAGCGSGLYCVDSPITRGEMAVFLAAALGLHFPN